ncbi:putative Sigma intracellular receptor 2 [Nannochloris sp. 'desiccata']|nr:hypothetical protein KSW81_002925 [Chlorella desiccata (nom. nud.)]KAH7624745.1 putative Sigma intracellular receptor 2 [Chlorella desiccata (nom. nud.)]
MRSLSSTTLVDSQGVFPRDGYPQFARDMLDNFIRDFKDPLMTAPLAPWFKALVWSEVLVQFPFFFVGAYAFITRKNWIRIPAIIYGSFVTATMIPIMGALAAHDAPGYNKVAVIGFYMPYLVIPALLVVVMAANVKPFATGKTNKTAGRRKAKRG